MIPIMAPIEEKAKVVAAIWGTEFIKFHAALTILHHNENENRMNSSFSSYHTGAIHPIFKSSWCKIASAARKIIHSVPQTAATTFTFSSVKILLLWGKLKLAWTDW